MLDYKNAPDNKPGGSNNGSGGNAGAAATPDQYQKKLDEILKKAGGQSRNAATPPAQPANPASANTVSQQPAAPAQPVTQPAAAATVPQASAPADPGDRLKKILAMAGMTPAQQAQAKAQAKAASTAKQAASILQKYKSALPGNPSAVLLLDVDFGSQGNNESVYMTAVADVNGNWFYSLFGNDIGYAIPDAIQAYELIDDMYYQGVPEQVLLGELASSVINQDNIM